MAVSFFGDFDTTETVVIPFNTFDSNDPSASVTATNLANTDVHIHKDGGLTQRSSAAGVAVDIDVDAIAGCHWVTIDLSDNTDAGFYADGSQYSVRVEGVTVDAATINPWIGAFSIGRMLRPTTAGRTLDVTATGAAGIDWGNVENPTTVQNLSATNIDTDQVVASVSGAVGSVTGAVGSVTGHTAQTGDSFARIGVAGAGLTNIDLPNQTMDITGNLSGSVGSVTGAVGSVTGAVGSVAGNVDGNVTGTVGGMVAAALADFFNTDSGTTYGAAVAGSVVKEIADNAGGSGLTESGIADAVWNEATAGHVAAGSFGLAVADTLADTNELQGDDVPGLIAALNDVAATDIVSAGAITTLAGAVVNVDLVDTTTTNTDMRGTDSAALATVATEARLAELDAGALPADVAAVKADTAAILTDTGTTLQAELDAIQAAVITNAAGVDIAADIIAVKADTAAILVDTADMQPKIGAPAANVSADIAAVKAETALILTDTGTTLQAELDAIQAAVITNAAGVDIAADIIAVKAETAAIVADTNELQADWADAGRLDAILDARSSQATADAIEADTQDLQARVPAALIGGRMDSDVEAINNNTEAAIDLSFSARTIVRGTAQTGTLSTTVMTSDVAEVTDDHFIGRIIIWTSGVLKDQASDITDYAGANGTFTYTATTEAPANTDTFVVV